MDLPLFRLLEGRSACRFGFLVGENILDFAKRLSQCFSGRLTALQAMASSLPDVRGGNH